MILSVILVSLLSVNGWMDSLIHCILATLIFWLFLVLMSLLSSRGKRQQKDSQENAFYQDMNTFMNVVRSQRHDYNLHVQTVASLIAQRKWEECRQYVNALVLDTTQMNEVLPVKAFIPGGWEPNDQEAGA